MFPCPVLNVNVLLHVCSCLPCVTPVWTIVRIYPSSPHSLLLSVGNHDWTPDQQRTLFACFFVSAFCSVFFLSLVFPMDAFIRPEYLLLLLEQGERSLKGHTRLFLDIAAFVEWILARNRSPFTVVLEDGELSPIHPGHFPCTMLQQNQQEDGTGASEPAPPGCSTAFSPRLWEPWTQITPPSSKKPHANPYLLKHGPWTKGTMFIG